MKRLLCAWAAASILLPFCPPLAQAERTHHRAGTSSAPFLKIGAGARPAAMGESATAAADDVHALYWNPAGLTAIDRPVFGATHQEAYQGLSHEFFGYAQPLMLKSGERWWRAPYRASWGASLQILSVPGDLERRSEETTGAMAVATASQGTFGGADMAFGASFGAEFRRHAFGATAKLIRQTIDNDTAHGAAVDLGWIGRDLFVQDLSLGAAILNLGPGIRFSQNWYPVPLSLKAGAAYRVRRLRTLLSADISVPRDDFPWFAFGTEVGLREYLFLRAGYRYRWHGNPLGGFSGFRTGLGAVYKSVSFDYAMAPFGELGISHRFSVGLKFGPARSEAPAAGALAETAPAPKLAPRQDPQPPLPVLELPPPAPQLETRGMTAYRVKASLKSVSARGKDFAVEAVSTDAATRIPRIEFRCLIPSSVVPSVAAGPVSSHPPLPSAYRPLIVRALETTAQGARSVFISLSLDEVTPDGFSVLGLFSGQWRELPSEPSEFAGRTVLRASSDRLPEAVALASEQR
ncbi:MAG: PorV/PorQ family protein [Elusimicrobiota bacterium]|jgi:hypothetical protein